jgi:DNA repair protein RecO (recombination protein O)
VEYELKGKSDFYFFHSCKLIDPFSGIRSDFTSLSLASYMTELTEILFPLGVADQNMFELLKDSFHAISEGKRNDVLRILFEARAMTLGGYGIDFDKCCNCKRPYRGEGRAVFKQSKGGIACLKCEKESRHSLDLSPDAVKGLKVLQSIPCSKVNALTLTHEAVQEIKPVLKSHIEYRIGQRLKTANFLENE